MPNLTRINRDDYARLLASRTLDASNGTLFGAGPQLQPNTINRTILIGLGGTGVRTIDYVKGAIIKRLLPTWRSYVSFLGIDTDWNEFSRSKHLDRGEQMMITTDTVQSRGLYPNTRSRAQRRLVPNEKLLNGLGTAGSGRKRQLGTFKIHDHATGDRFGVDDRIAQYINTAARTIMSPLVPPGKYEIYVIGSLCGGTCSGGFTELPALVARALNGTNYSMHGVFYLPDVVSGLDPNNANEFYANAYASLKELDYYLGETMRGEHYYDTWIVNDQANPEIRLPQNGMRFYELPYLIGSTAPGGQAAFQVALETVAEHFITLLSDMTAVGDNGIFSVESFISNAVQHVDERLKDPGDDGLEHAGENHERPKRYGSFGYAVAEAPEKLTRAYVIAEACKKAGLRSVPAEERAALAAGGAIALLPFRGENDYLTAVNGTADARQIIAPLEDYLDHLHDVHMNMLELLDIDSKTFNWSYIRRGNMDDPNYSFKCEAYVRNHSDAESSRELQDAIANSFSAYKSSVMSYVKREGPLAFVNVFDGKFIPGSSKDSGVGIRVMLERIRDGQTMESGTDYDWLRPTEAQNELDRIRRIIDNVNVLNPLTLADRVPQQAAWRAAYERKYTSMIVEARRGYVLGSNGLFDRYFLQPACILRDQLEAFGYLLQSLTGIYEAFGNELATFNNFANATDKPNEVNIAALGTVTYNWIKEQADNAVAVVNAQETRNQLIDNFFEDPTAWLNVPQEITRQSPADPGRLELASEETPIPARVRFDEFISQKATQTINATIQTMFDELKGANQSYNATAQQIAHSLRAKSQPAINGAVSPNYIVAVYPAELQAGGTGRDIEAAITRAFTNEFRDLSLQVFASADAASISCYQFAVPFEVYKLNDLAAWESQYLNEIRNAPFIAPTVSKAVSSELHSISPSGIGIPGNPYCDVDTSSDLYPAIPWEEYPAITVPGRDPRMRDPVTGVISFEGEIRLKIDKIVEECRKLGVLYCDRVAKGRYQVMRVFCHESIDWNHFDVTLYDPSANGLIEIGKPLAVEIARQHNTTLAAISRPVKLEEGGIFTNPAATEERAWENAKRVLRTHIPMYCEVLKTLAKFREWDKVIEDINANVRARLRPAMMQVLLEARFYARTDDGKWKLKETENGEPRIIANPAMVKYLPKEDRLLIENGLLAFYLFRKLDFALPGEKLVQCYHEASSYITELVDHDYREDLEDGKTKAKFVLEEREELFKKGAQPDIPRTLEEVRIDMQFKRNMPSDFDDQTLKEIQAYYARTQLRDTL